MAFYVLKRLLAAIPTLLLVAASVFFLMRLIPGDPALLILGDAATPESVADLRAAMGLDRSLPVQFGLWLSQVAAGDLGLSITSGEAVGPLILDRFGVTAAIVLAAVDGDKVQLAAGVTADCTGRVKAGELVNFVARQVGGKGGGKPDMAMAGGTDASGLPQALQSVQAWVAERA